MLDSQGIGKAEDRVGKSQGLVVSAESDETGEDEILLSFVWTAHVLIDGWAELADSVGHRGF